MHDQTQSQLFLVPGEIRNEIYKHCLVSSRPIIDACIPVQGSLTIRSVRHSVPPLGIALFRSCKRAFEEMPAKLLYTQNLLRFTTSTHAHRFLRSLPAEQANLITDIELDLGSQRGDNTVHREWSQYVAWKPDCGVWAQKLGSLRIDAPMLRTIRLDIGDSVFFVGSAVEVILEGPEGLDRIVVTASKNGMLEENYIFDVPLIQGHLTIFGKAVKRPLIVSMMAKCVSGDDDAKFVKWEEVDRQLTLEVVSERALSRTERNTPFTILPKPRATPALFSKCPGEGAMLWNGVLTLTEYKERQAMLLASAGLNPTAS